MFPESFTGSEPCQLSETRLRARLRARLREQLRRVLKGCRLLGNIDA